MTGRPADLDELAVMNRRLYPVAAEAETEAIEAIRDMVRKTFPGTTLVDIGGQP